MKIKREVLGTVGQCIYCRTTRGPLQEEHIVPYALSGPWVLLKASCKECAEITSAFELNVCRNALPAPRAALSLPSRHKPQRPTTFPLVIERGGQKEVIEVPLEEHLTVMMLPIFALPTCLDQRRYKKGIDVIGSAIIQVGGPKGEELLKKHDANSLAVQVTYEPVAFARLLAKIAYGFTVAEFGLSKIEEAHVLPAILGKSDDVGRWVGCAADNRLAAGSHLHEIKLSVISGEIRGHVRLFAQFNAPEYLVIVGRMSEHSSAECELSSGSGV